MTNWQPIETAPRDGTAILVWCRLENHGPGEFASIAFWSEYAKGWRIPAFLNNHIVPVAPRLWSEIEAPDIINGLPEEP